MRMTAFLAILLTVSTQVFALGMGDRPLRTLKIGSELYISVTAQLMADGFYQEGTQVIPNISMDETKPFCQFSMLSSLPPHDQRSTPLKLSKSDGGHYDRGEDDTWAQFKTSLRFSSKTKPHDFVVDCFSKSNGLFKEMTLNEFAGVFGEKIHFGKVDLDDHGIEKRQPL